MKKEKYQMKIWKMVIINMKNIKLIKKNGINFLCFTWFNNKKYSFIWEFDFKNIWWFPKYIKEKYTKHYGWLFLQIGFGKPPELIDKKGD